MSSKFFRAESSESEDDEQEESTSESASSEESGSESSSESGSDSDSSSGSERPNRFLNESDSESDEGQRVVKSGRDKRFDAMLETSQRMRNHLKIRDWTSVQTDYDSLNRQLEKHLTADIVTGKRPPVPLVYIGTVALVEDQLNEMTENRDSIKMSKTNTKAFNTVKQRVRKNNKQYSEDIARWRASERTLDDDDLIEDDADEAAGGDKAAGNRSHRIMGDEASDDDRELGDGDALAAGGAAGGAGMAERKLKPEDMSEAQLHQRLQEILAGRGRKGTNKREQISHIEELLAGAKSPAQRIDILLSLVSARFDLTAVTTFNFMEKAMWNAAVANVREVLAIARENAGTLRFRDDAENELLMTSAGGDGGGGDADDAAGLAAAADGNEQNSRDRSNQPPPPPPLAAGGGEAADRLPPTAAAEKPGAADGGAAGGQTLVRGDLVTVVERLDDELFRAWQNTDAYAAEYVERLKDERPLLALMADAQDYFENVTANYPRAARLAARLILHLYYKSDGLRARIAELERARGGDGGAGAYGGGAEAAAEDKSLHELAVLVYRHGDDRAKSQTMLCHIYNHALSDRFYEGRDMLLLSHLQESISMLDVSLQVLFNRTMAQLGLCAFRLGMPQEAHAALQELCTSSYSGSGGGAIRLKELLAQGMVQVRGVDKSVEQERAERRRQVPYHMHLPLDFIDTAHLVSAMLLEVPNMALQRLRGDVYGRRKIISKTFQFYLRSSMKQAFTGPPENTRDHVMAAAKRLMASDWLAAYDTVASIRAWGSLDGHVAKATLAKVRELIKVEGLQTFVLTYSSFYDSLSLGRLASTFELSPSKVHSVISKMIINDELRASWDQPTGAVVVRRTEPTRLQSLALQLTQKCSSLVEHNEKLVDMRTSGPNSRGDDRDDGREWKGGSRGGRGRGGSRGGGRYYRDRDRDRVTAY